MADHGFLAGLNEAQRRAVLTDDGPVLIIAGPGTGKTKTLTARIAQLLEQGIQPTDIVALTFTNKAAREMRERLVVLLGPNIVLPQIATFHALGRHILERADRLRPIVTETVRQDIFRSLAKSAAYKGISAREMSLRISRLKISCEHPSDPDAALLAAYNQQLQNHNVQDFDDLLQESLQLLQEGTGRRYAHVLVDEFQDTSELQYRMLQALLEGRNLFAIGDPNQSIYAFRGAGAVMFTRFQADFPAATIIALTSNYRSRSEIVRLANAIFPDAPHLTAQTDAPGTVRVVQTLNEYSEAAYVLGSIEQGIGGSDLLKASGDHQVHEPRDYAVLYRTHRAALAVQKTFADSGLPYQVAGEGSPYERPEIQTVIALLRYLYHQDEPTKQAIHSLPFLQRISLLQRNTLLVTCLAIDTTQSVCDMASATASMLTLPADHNVQQLASTLAQFGSGREELHKALTHLEDISGSEFYDSTVNAVTLMTIHASKGLEFGHVFLIAAEEGILPKRANNEIDEERRLFYVAATRAKDTLEILHARVRGGKPAVPSRFVTELPRTALPCHRDPALPALEKRLRKRAVKRAQTTLL